LALSAFAENITFTETVVLISFPKSLSAIAETTIDLKIFELAPKLNPESSSA
jgi:hypothetical protein